MPKVNEDDMERLHKHNLSPESSKAKFRSKKQTSFHFASIPESEVDQRVDNWRWNTADSGANPSLGSSHFRTSNTSDIAGQESSQMLSRILRVQIQPIAFYVTDVDSSLLFGFCVRSYRSAFPKSVKAKSKAVLSRIQEINLARSIRQHLVHARIKLDEAKFFDTQFKAVDISGDGFLSPDELKTVLCKMMKPLNLLASEIDEKVLDIIFELDYDLDGQVSVEEFRKCFMKAQDVFSTKSRIPLLAKEYDGTEVPEFIYRGAQVDSGNSRQLWNLIENEIGIKYSEYSLHGFQPIAVQHMLARLCGDWRLARSVWENVVRPNLAESRVNGMSVPWISRKDDVVGISLNLKDVASEFLSSRFISPLKITERYSETKVLNSFTKIFIDVSQFQINFLDAFLGPLVSRIYINVSDIYVDCELLNEGINPNFSAASKDSVGLTGGFKLNVNFFNSLVQTNEPLLEPWSMTYVIRKKESEGFLDFLVKAESLNLNLSTSCLQTIAAFIMQMFGSISNRFQRHGNSVIKIPSGKRKMSIDMTNHNALVDDRPPEDEPSTSFLVRNFAGCSIGLRVSSLQSPLAGTDVFIDTNSSQYLKIPVYVNDGNNSNQATSVMHSFPSISITANFVNPNLQFRQNNPISLHLLTLNSIAIYPSTSSEFKLEGKDIPAFIMDLEREVD